MRLAQIIDGVVANIAEVEPDAVPEFMADWIDAGAASPGWRLVNGALVPPPPEAPPPPDPKLVGVLFDGVMCSATKDDQTGLLAVLAAIQLQGAAFPGTRFEFENGNSLVITLQNYQRFMATWLPFRQSFFVPGAA